MNKNQKIKCEVESCKFQDKKMNCCNLEEIEVGCNRGNTEARDVDATICKSFQYNSKK